MIVEKYIVLKPGNYKLAKPWAVKIDPIYYKDKFESAGISPDIYNIVIIPAGTIITISINKRETTFYIRKKYNKGTGLPAHMMVLWYYYTPSWFVEWPYFEII